MSAELSEDAMLLAGRLIREGYDVRITKHGRLVIRTPQSRAQVRRALYPEGKSAILTRPTRGYYVVSFS